MSVPKIKVGVQGGGDHPLYISVHTPLYISVFANFPRTIFCYKRFLQNTIDILKLEFTTYIAKIILKMTVM